MDVKRFFQSEKFKWVVISIGILAVILLILQAGMSVGYKKAAFSYKWGEDYYRAFGPGPGKIQPRNGGVMPMMRGQFPESYGVSGRILKIDFPVVIIEGKDGVEKAVLIQDGTAIRRFRENVKISDLKEGDMVVVIGSPNNDSQIEAKLVRIFPEGQVPLQTQQQKPFRGR